MSSVPQTYNLKVSIQWPLCNYVQGIFHFTLTITNEQQQLVVKVKTKNQRISLNFKDKIN